MVEASQRKPGAPRADHKAQRSLEIHKIWGGYCHPKTIPRPFTSIIEFHWITRFSDCISHIPSHQNWQKHFEIKSMTCRSQWPRPTGLLWNGYWKLENSGCVSAMGRTSQIWHQLDEGVYGSGSYSNGIRHSKCHCFCSQSTQLDSFSFEIVSHPHLWHPIIFKQGGSVISGFTTDFVGRSRLEGVMRGLVMSVEKFCRWSNKGDHHKIFEKVHSVVHSAEVFWVLSSETSPRQP